MEGWTASISKYATNLANGIAKRISVLFYVVSFALSVIDILFVMLSRGDERNYSTTKSLVITFSITVFFFIFPNEILQNIAQRMRICKYFKHVHVFLHFLRVYKVNRKANDQELKQSNPTSHTQIDKH